MAQDRNRTYHANQALQLSELVNLQFARVRFGSDEPRLVRMREPDGPSTDAGRKARQPLMLVRAPDDESGTVFGFVDLFKRTADLRGYDVIRQQHQQRFGVSFRMTRNEYGRLIDETRLFLISQAIETRILNHPRGRTASLMSAVSLPALTAPSPSRSGVRWTPLLLFGAIGFALCYLLLALGVLPLPL